MRPAAERLADLLGNFFDGPLPVRLRAWDGSEAGPVDVPLVVLRGPDAMRRLLWQPNELELAEAYVAGDIDVHGDLAQALGSAGRTVREQRFRRPGAAALASVTVLAAGLGAAGPPPRRPHGRAYLSGRLHSALYGVLLDATMAYSCGYGTRAADATYGTVRGPGRQDGADLRQARTAHRGPAPRRRLRLGLARGPRRPRGRGRSGGHPTAPLAAHRRSGYDAAAAVEMGEHAGDAEYPRFARMLHAALRPEGRHLVQQMSRGANAPGGGRFIETYIAPDMYIRPLGRTSDLLESAGLEVQSDIGGAFTARAGDAGRYVYVSRPSPSLLRHRCLRWRADEGTVSSSGLPSSQVGDGARREAEPDEQDQY